MTAYHTEPGEVLRYATNPNTYDGTFDDYEDIDLQLKVTKEMKINPIMNNLKNEELHTT